MASRQVRCNQCGSVLMVPAAAVRVVECRVCHGMNQIRPSTGPWSQVYNSFHQFGGRLRSFVNTIMPGSVNRNPGYYYGTTPQLGYYPRPSYNVFGPKRAVLCGIRYHGQDSQQLNGTVNDVKNMNMFLVKYCGFPRESILILTDDMEERDPLKFPTKYNIQMAMRWLIEGSQSGDSLVFHFAGHGAQKPDMSGDELDRSDEVICPVDSREQGNILDDEINATIVRPLPRGAKLHAVIDSCHSGTVLDLAYVWSLREGYWTWDYQYYRVRRPNKDTSGGVAICISGCHDDQSSKETPALSGGYAFTGAFTYSFIYTMLNEPGLSYGRLLSAMRSIIRGIPNDPYASLFNTDFIFASRQCYKWLGAGFAGATAILFHGV
ncbi:Metacaspase-3 isoform B [Glycine soja]|uniref:Metacaspase-3 isoform B n=1 Tax=Glycine soja TaxID=3848 RepID=A0A445JB29_GLYSO|nr:Metacaspase-3 isoform B [Glycine soja]